MSSSYHIPGIPVIPNDRAARRRNGPPFNPFPHKVSFKPTESTRSTSVSSSVVRNESFSSVGSSALRSAVRPSGISNTRSASATSSVIRNQSFSAAGSSVVRSALRPSGTSDSRSSSTSSSSGRLSSSVSSRSDSGRSGRSVSSRSAVVSASSASSASSSVSSSARFAASSRSLVPRERTALSTRGVTTSLRSTAACLPRSTEPAAAIGSRATGTSTRSGPFESTGYFRGSAKAVLARLNAKYPGRFAGSRGPPSAPVLKSAMRKPGTRKSEKRVQFSGGHVKIVDRWIVPGVDTYRDHTPSLLGKLGGWKVTPLPAPDNDGETDKYIEYWCTSLTQLRSHSGRPCERSCAYSQLGQVQRELNRRNGITDDDDPRDIPSIESRTRSPLHCCTLFWVWVGSRFYGLATLSSHFNIQFRFNDFCKGSNNLAGRWAIPNSYGSSFLRELVSSGWVAGIFFYFAVLGALFRRGWVGGIPVLTVLAICD
ncbi:uncharacterized protein CIMG_07537 [Coccidioides immitis RS]|uniref:Uncharacterized protein n=1 Tax=Coccidioides immitis (strain RS) TaxID=246410 RepID=A0A0E1RUY9_COCIM|nr:uncharacterized protein CIMG_07537 [Coccidioides immitis RS]EAS28791.2 hypothetical protein CIMG_07537 [Coccidioides immitis RS]